GPFAVDEGLARVTEPVTRVRIFNTNTKKIIEAEVPIRGGRARTEGDFAIDGVPGAGAKTVMNFVNSAGSRTGKLLPTGNVADEIQLKDGRTVRASRVDAAKHAVFFHARDVAFNASEL